jgi:hypothetical protein
MKCSSFPQKSSPLSRDKSSPACRSRSGCILDNLNQLANALDESLANHSMIQIVQLDIQTDLPRLRNR